MKLSRRGLLMAAASMVAFRSGAFARLEKASKHVRGIPESVAEDEDFWLGVRQCFALDPNIVNFNNGGCSPSPRVVHDCLRRQQEFGNQAPSYFMWRHLEPEIESTRKRLAAVFGCDPEEMAITRNASEALETCIFGLPIAPVDEALTTSQDYPRMINAIKQRGRREAVRYVEIKVPAAPETHKELTKAFEDAVTDTTRMILVSHVVFLTGQIYPVRDICRLGKKHGVPVIVDGAHAFAQFPFVRNDLECEFYGTSLHKWLMAPIGTGFLYVKKSRIPDVWPLMASNGAEQDKDIRKFEEIGTHQAALHNAIGEALTFHEMLGAERKAARLRYLRSRWTSRLLQSNETRVRFHTNLDQKHSCGLCTVEVLGIPPADLVTWLHDKHHIYVTPIEHPDFKGIRVTPNVYTTLAEVDRFASAMEIAASKGIK